MATPSALSAQTNLSWTASSGATGYIVKRANAIGGPYIQLAAVTSANYSDIATTAGRTYYYVVASLNPAGSSTDSAIASATTYTKVENWRYLHFGTTADAGNAADTADPDGDGIPNLFERAFGGNPNAPDRNILPAIDNAPVLSIIYRKAKAATDLVLTVHESPDLSPNSWTTANGTSTVLSDDGVVQVIRFTAPADTAKKIPARAGYQTLTRRPRLR